LIIAIEGIDRIGKTTQAKLLANALGCEVIKFPYEGDFTGKRVREILQKKYPFEPAGFQALNIMNKVKAQEMIKVANRSLGNVVLDRYKLSNIVYALADDLPLDWVLVEAEHILEPDLTIMLRGHPFEKDSEIYGKLETQAKVSALYYRCYRHLVKKNSEAIKLVEANQSIDTVQKSILDCVSKARTQLAGAQNGGAGNV